MSESDPQPQQHGCTLVNAVGCITIPAGLWLGVRFGYEWRGIGGALAGTLIGAIAGVIAMPLLAFALVAIAYVGHLAQDLAAKLQSRK